MRIIDDERAQALANAIVVQAAEDYRRARKYLKKHPKTSELVARVEAMTPRERSRTREGRLLNEIIRQENMAAECERFFRSQWCSCLTKADGVFILRKLEEEFADESD